MNNNTTPILFPINNLVKSIVLATLLTSSLQAATISNSIRTEMVACESITNLQANIGTPANGASHSLQVTWNAVTGASAYEIEYSTDGIAFSGLTEVVSNTYTFNAGANPNKGYWFRVRVKNTTENCDWTTMAAARFTAANSPGLLAIASTTSSLTFTIPAEIPAANPVSTFYSIFCTTNNQYVLSNGSFSATETFLSKAAWSNVIVSGLPAQTQYCFYAKAKNSDGDVRYASGNQVISTQEFNSNVLTTNTSTAAWYAPNSNPPFTWSASGGCSGGRIGYSGTFNNFWGNFIRLPQQDYTGSSHAVLKFDVTNSYVAATPNSYFRFYIWADGGYKQVVSGLKLNGAPVTANNYGTFFFNQLRNCVPVEVTFDLATITNRSNILMYMEVICAYNNSSEFSVYFDNITTTGGVPAACATTVLGVNDHQLIVGLYPNPVQHELTIDTPKTIQKTEIFSLTGQLIQTDYSKTAVPVSALSKGMYVLKITLEDGSLSTERFIKN